MGRASRPPTTRSPPHQTRPEALCFGYVLQLREILVSHVGDLDERSLVLSGKREHVQGFLRLLYSLAEQEALLVQRRIILSRGRCTLSDEDIKRVGSHLPEKLGKDIHKTIAAELGLEERQVYYAIRMLLDFRGHSDTEPDAA